jgi:hypothetical protein
MGDTGVVQDAFRQGCFARIDVSGNANVADARKIGFFGHEFNAKTWAVVCAGGIIPFFAASLPCLPL